MCRRCELKTVNAISTLMTIQGTLTNVLDGLAGEREDVEVQEACQEILALLREQHKVLMAHGEEIAKVMESEDPEGAEMLREILTDDRFQSTRQAIFHILELSFEFDYPTAAAQIEHGPGLAAVLGAIMQGDAEEDEPPFDIPGLSDQEADDLFHDDEED